MMQLVCQKVGATSSATSRPTTATVGLPSAHGRQSTKARAPQEKLVGGTDDPPNLAVASSDGAANFLGWLVEHGLSRRAWTVDEIWYLASEDYAPALGFALPPRRVFLGALQKCAGVVVQYDKRIYTREGRYVRKTTFYRFSSAPHATSHQVARHDLPPVAYAA